MLIDGLWTVHVLPFSPCVCADQKKLFLLVILTEEYVTSKWPMLELLSFLEAQESTNPGLKLLPVFFDNQLPTNIDDSWIAAWEKMKPESSGTSSVGRRTSITLSVESCKKALRKLRKSNGCVLDNSQSMKSLQQQIVQAALKFLPLSSEMDTENVQGCLRLCKRTSEMFEEYKEEDRRGAQCLGLYGIGGLGKTTICNALCNYFGPDFNHKVCHLEIGSNDTDPKANRFKRHILIQKRLSDLSREAIESVEYTEDSHQAVKSVRLCLSEQRVFLAVDNVQNDTASWQEAREYLSLLSRTSKIIFTSRSRDTVLSVLRNGKYCKPVPYLEEEEAKTLFLKIAAPDQVNRSSLDPQQTRILGAWLRTCYFPLENETNHDVVPGKGGHHSANAETGHYHPLALQMVASFLKDRYPEPDRPILCWEEASNYREVVFHLGESKEIFDVLGIGFESMRYESKQLFIDVALFADSEDIFNWLVCIYGCNAEFVQAELKLLRKKSFLNYEVGTSSEASCINISMHELYREFAKRYVGNQVSKYGVYDDGSLPLPPSESWTTVPRIFLRRFPNAAKVREWGNVVVVRLVGCETITTFSIGELWSLRDLEISSCSKLGALSWMQDDDIDVTKQPDGKSSTLSYVSLRFNKSLRKLPDFSSCANLLSILVKSCFSSMEPLRLHSCSNLQQLRLLGNDVPEVQSLRSCSKLRTVHFAWKATHRGFPRLENLPSLWSLAIGSKADVFLNRMHWFSPASGQNLQNAYPQDSVCHDLSGVGVLPNLELVDLTCIPLGRLPVELATVAPNLRHLCLVGCLLGPSVDFSAFTSLHLLLVWKAEGEAKVDYNLCDSCFSQSGCDRRDFDSVHFSFGQPPPGAPPKSRYPTLEVGFKNSCVSKRHNFGDFTLRRDGSSDLQHITIRKKTIIF